MKINLPEKAVKIIKKLEEAGFSAYIVGGCVRDSIIGSEVSDWDICTSATPLQMKECLKEYKLLDIGMKHGTITVVDEKQAFEVTTFRIDGKYLDNRHPDEVNFVTSLEEDLSRRDFTVNAMAYSERDGLIDLFGGQNDLKAGIIKCIGDPKKRFEEDGLRILRGLRFASVLGFEIEDKTSDAILECRNLLEGISAERIRTELNKILCGNNVRKVLNDYAEVIAVFIPEIRDMFGFDQHNKYHNLDVWQHTLKTIELIPPTVVLRVTMLLHDISKPEAFILDKNGNGHFRGHPQMGAKKSVVIMRRLKYDNATIARVQLLIFCHDGRLSPEPKSVKGWLNQTGEDAFRQVLLVKKADAGAKKPEVFEERIGVYQQVEDLFEKIISEKQCYQAKDMLINGRDLMHLGVPQGKYIGVLINQLLEDVINDIVPNEREALLKRASALLGETTRHEKKDEENIGGNV